MRARRGVGWGWGGGSKRTFSKTKLHGRNVPATNSYRCGVGGGGASAKSHVIFGRLTLDNYPYAGELLASTRRNMPMDRHRRYDIYGGGPHGAPLGSEGGPGDADASIGFG